MDVNEEVLAAAGWEVDCESPLEISHRDGSTATKRAAQIVLMWLEEVEALEDDDDGD